MLGGGHFAGAVYEGDRIMAHRGVHRYTVRKKQGGSQSSHDSKGGNAQSAGAQIRRHNEKRLREDVLSTLAEWRPLMSHCTHVFVHAPGANRFLLFGHASEAAAITPPLSQSDRRICGVPFTVGRATLAEIRRAYETLSRAIVTPATTPAVASPAAALCPVCGGTVAPEGDVVMPAKTASGPTATKKKKKARQTEAAAAAAPAADAAKKKRKKKKKRTKQAVVVYDEDEDDEQDGESQQHKKPAAASTPAPAPALAPQGPPCSCCAKPIVGDPFERLEYKYCSTACVRAHKLVLGQ
eukprot:TRINITY_DN5740_c0_g1_i2.p1 TRINITY_DN5740_c0_g1~~TRINITY_DN5740_c0_g1_i2.p1  ORF type:complete len:296 (-),score=82.72 TRINITY_DN5740_c0_g1_i2:21-908(-)